MADVKPDEETLQQENEMKIGGITEKPLAEDSQPIHGLPEVLMMIACQPFIEVENGEHQEMMLQKNIDNELDVAANESNLKEFGATKNTNDVQLLFNGLETQKDIKLNTSLQAETRNITSDTNITELSKINKVTSEVKNTSESLHSDVDKNDANFNKKLGPGVTEEVPKLLDGLQDGLPGDNLSEKAVKSRSTKGVSVTEKAFQPVQIVETQGQELIILDLPSVKSSKNKNKKKRIKEEKKQDPPKIIKDISSMPPTVQCAFCVKKFNTHELKENHEKFHTEERPCKCTFCEKRFTTIGGQRRHERKFHTGENLLKCSFCEKTFATATALRRHERVHTDVRPYECSQCAANFKDSTDLRRHERRHTGEKPFKCKICDRAFTVRSAMNRHQRVHTGAKPYLCDQCGQAFTDRFSLKQHIKGHSRGKVYKCGVCDKGFSFRYHLHTHKRECGNNLTIEDVESKVSASLVAKKDTAGTTFLQLTESIVGSQMVYFINQVATEDDPST